MSENLVIVRAFGGKPLVRAVLDVMPGGVLVCKPENADAIRRGERSGPLVGFPNEDVFRYDAQAIGAAGNVNWERLARMKETVN